MITSFIRRHEVLAYYAIACVLSIGLALLLNVSLLFGLLALFGPAVAALIVARTAEGRAGVRAIRAAATRWRVGPGWYAAAIGLPLAGFAIGHLLYVAVGNEPLAVPGAIAPISIVLFVLVIGEEIGWRGFMLPVLLRRRSPLEATIIVACAWAAWHSPLYLIPGMPSYGTPFLPFVVWVIGLSFLLTWVWLGTRSVWLATIVHGVANLGAALVFPVLDAATLFTFAGAGTAVVAAVLVIASWRTFTTHPSSPAAASAPVAAVEGPEAAPGRVS